MVKSNSKRKNTFPDSPLLYTHQAGVARKLGESSTISAQTHKRLLNAILVRRQPIREEFLGDDQANRLCRRAMRSGWYI